MIRIGNKELDFVRVGTRTVSAIYIGTKLVWQAIRSCFGSGYWISTSPWKNDEGWKN
jgi:hypothetical protein